MKILTVTMNPTIDTSIMVDRVRPDVKLRSGAPKHEPGGGGINVSRAIKILGGESLAFFMAGGTNGKMLKDILNGQKLEQLAIPIAGLTRENIMVFEESSDQQFRFVLPGPRVSEKECADFADKLKSLKDKPEYLVISGSVPPGASAGIYAEIARNGKEMGAKIIVDSKGKELKRSLEEGVFLIKPNLRELKELSGRDFKNESEMKEAAEEIRDQGQSEVVVVSLGAAGVLVVSEDFAGRLPTPTVPIKSKVGAGDSMVAGMTFYLARNRSLIESIMFGIAAGASAVMTAGTELCRREDTENLYAKIIGEYMR